MAKVNAINNKTGILTVRPEFAGDQWVQFDINDTGEFRIGDDATDDSFRISQGSALGTNDTFIMTSAGERTMPLQPAFHAYQPSQDTDVTGDGTVYSIGTNVAWTERFDQNSDFNTNGTFTSPVTGRYTFHVQVKLSDIDASHSQGFLILVASNRILELPYINPGLVVYEGGDLFTMVASSTFDMDAADTMVVDVRVAVGTLTVDIDGSASGNETIFSGYLSV